MADDQHTDDTDDTDDTDAAPPAPKKARAPKVIKFTGEVHPDGQVEMKIGSVVVSHGNQIPVAFIELKRALVREVEDTEGFSLNY